MYVYIQVHMYACLDCVLFCCAIRFVLSLLDAEQAGMVQMVADHVRDSGMLSDPGALFTYYQYACAAVVGQVVIDAPAPI